MENQGLLCWRLLSFSPLVHPRDFFLHPKKQPVPATTRLGYCCVKHDYFSPFIKQHNTAVIFRCGFSALNL